MNHRKKEGRKKERKKERKKGENHLTKKLKKER
jgi:hypothetical protein